MSKPGKRSVVNFTNILSAILWPKNYKAKLQSCKKFHMKKKLIKYSWNWPLEENCNTPKTKKINNWLQQKFLLQSFLPHIWKKLMTNRLRIPGLIASVILWIEIMISYSYSCIQWVSMNHSLWNITSLGFGYQFKTSKRVFLGFLAPNIKLRFIF